MSKAWTDIPSTDIDAESPITEDLLTDFFNNQEALISQPVDFRFDEVTTSAGSYATIFTRQIWVPPPVATTDGNVTLKLRIEVKVSSGTGRIQVQLGSGTYIESSDITGTSYAAIDLVISDTDVKAVADSVSTITVQGRNIGGGTTYAKNEALACRFERAA